jgi:DNA-binding NarL/FixJ family response regulator
MATMENGPRGKIGRPALRVVLADDHAILRHALATLLDARSDLQVIAEAADGREAIDATERHRPDVVIMDVGMPRLNGIEATRQIHARFPSTKVLILSAYGDAASVGNALAAGACGFIIKRSDIDELVLALRLVTTGNVYVSRELAEHMDIGELTFSARNRGAEASALTDREREVLQLIAEGHTLRAIADILILSPKTVEGHNSRIMAKVGARNRADLVRYALGAGLVRPEKLSDAG